VCGIINIFHFVDIEPPKETHRRYAAHGFQIVLDCEKDLKSFDYTSVHDMF